MASEKQLLDSLFEKIYQIVTGPDPIHNLQAGGGSFVSFCLPGMPITGDELEFSFIDPAKKEAAADFASLVNTVPSFRGYWAPSDRKVDDYYRRVLDESVRPVLVLNAAEKKRLLEAQETLTRWVQIPDATSGAMRTIAADTPLYETYQERAGEYFDALMIYKSLQADALARPNDAAAQAAWFAKGPIFQQQVKLKMQRWVSGGKLQVEKAQQTITELGRGTGERWARMREILEQADETTANGSHYLFTKYFPAKFWDAAHSTAWTRFSMSREEVHEVDEKSSVNYGGGGSASVGLWSVSASASYAEQKEHFKSDGLMSGVEVELIRVPLRRSWWDASVFWDRGWKFDKNITNLVLSDGAMPPAGEMTCYPTAMIVARNLKLGIDMTSTENNHVATQFSASASVGWGPFSLRGNYSKSTDQKTHDFVRTNAGIECAGMQIVGFACELLPKSPNPDLTLNWQA